MSSVENQIHIALAGNPNSGKTTMFNALTGSSQHVGNWPGVTVQKKEGKLKGHSDVRITDLPGIYSLSPYTLEEVVSRDYLLNDRPNAILNLVDATNLERNLYLTTQILELGIPTVIALNMMDLVNKSGDKINEEKLSKSLGCPVVATSALKNEGVIAAAEKAASISGKTQNAIPVKYSDMVENALSDIYAIIKPKIHSSNSARWYTVKVFERDAKVLEALALSGNEKEKLEKIIANVEKSQDDDSESIITNERYEYIGKLISTCLKKGNKGLSVSDKIDRVVTNRILALPIFVAVMFLVYFISISTVGTWCVELMEELFDEMLAPGVEELMESAGAADWITGLLVEGIIGGVGAVLSFVPQMLILFLMLCLLEDCGYMARVAFIMDRIFRRFGLSGKSFIPMLISTGCAVPGIMASKTIENEKDRRMTVMTTAFMPCGAKLPIIALIAGTVFGDAWWFAPSAYFIGIAAIIISGIILKKTRIFAGDPAPFVMELPPYHVPKTTNIIRGTWERGWSFIKRAGTVILVASIVIWFTGSYGWVDGSFGGVEDIGDSMLGVFGNGIRYIFLPLGFGEAWQTAVAIIIGLVAKEEVVGAMGTMAAIEGDALEMVEEGQFAGVSAIAGYFTSSLVAYAFLLFNLLCAPCSAAIGAIRREMNSAKWTWFAVGYMTVFAYAIALMVYQFGSLFIDGVFGVGTVCAIILLGLLIYLLFRPDRYKTDLEKASASNLS